MKNYFRILVFIFSGLILVSCNQKKLEMQEQLITELGAENDSLIQLSKEKDAAVNEFFETMAQIRNNLNEIKLRQNMISEETRDRDNVGQDVRTQIEADLLAINNLMEDNRTRLATLNRQLRASNVKVTEFESMVSGLSTEIEEKNNELNQLRANMENLNVSNTQLTQTITQLEEESNLFKNEIEQKTDQINTAWYVYGTKKQLREQEIINLQGGILGMGRTPVVNSNVKKENFMRLNIASVDTVFIPGKNANLISIHPVESYVVKSDGENNSMIFIEDPELFWSNTRYLIVSVE